MAIRMTVQTLPSSAPSKYAGLYRDSYRNMLTWTPEQLLGDDGFMWATRVLQVPCKHCDARPVEWCKHPNGNPYEVLHVDRFRSAIAQGVWSDGRELVVPLAAELR